MINSANSYTISQLWADDINVFYSVPKYQREYAWNKENWNGLFEDISEGPSAYFLGSIICINRSKDANQLTELELVDGQQRFVTLSILYCALYSFYKKFYDVFDDQEKRRYESIVGRLLLSRNKLKLNPSHQNNNDDDYMALLAEAKIPQCQGAYKQNFKKRRIYKAYDFFSKKLEATFADKETVLRDELDGFFKKVNNVTMVKIEVQSSVDAYILFESLNNRGLPLTVMDLLRNLVYARIEEYVKGDDAVEFSEWEKVIENIGRENARQERFFRSVYNAFKGDDIFIDNSEPEAKKSNLIQIYERVINNNALAFLERINGLCEHYKKIIEPEESELDEAIRNELVNLDRVSGAPSYSLILYLLEKQSILRITNSHLKKILSAVVTFFVWRHATDKPSLKELVKLFADIIAELKILDLKGDDLEKKIVEKLKLMSASEEDFKKALLGPMYDDNRDLTRYLLFSIEMANQTHEGIDVWAKKDNKGSKKDKWSIEHILPQGNLNDEWVRMLTGGISHTDKEKANDMRTDVLHSLGNLTITAYNSNLSNSSFEKKKNATNDRGLKIGYNNGLYLNKNVINKSIWSETEIKDRTEWLIDAIMSLFKL